MFVYLRGRTQIYNCILSKFPRDTIHPDHFFMTVNKTHFKRCSFPLSAALMWSAELHKLRGLGLVSYSNMIASFLVFLSTRPPTTYFYFFLNSHSIQKPLHLLCGPSQITCPGYPTNKMSVSLPVKAPEAESHPAEKWIYFTAVSLTWHQTCTNLWMHIYNPPPFSSFPACFLFFKLKVNWEAGTFASHKGRPYFML